MSNLVFPTLAARDIKITRTPIHQTAVQWTQSRKRLVGSWEFAPLTSYKISFNRLKSDSLAEFQQIVGFFARHAGRYDSFLWTDPEDNAVTAHPFGVGNGSLVTFQLQRTLVPSAYLNSGASRTYWPLLGDGYEPVYDPVTTTDTEYVNGSSTGITHGSNGLVTFASPPANNAVLTWTGSYYKRVMFADDSLPLDRFVNQFWKSGEIELLSVKP